MLQASPLHRRSRETVIKNWDLMSVFRSFSSLGVSHFARESPTERRLYPGRGKEAMMARPSWTSLCLGLIVLVQSEYLRLPWAPRLEFIELICRPFQLHMDSTRPATNSGIGQNSFGVSTQEMIPKLMLTFSNRNRSN